MVVIALKDVLMIIVVVEKMEEIVHQFVDVKIVKILKLKLKGI